jgi:hypothetical protein
MAESNFQEWNKRFEIKIPHSIKRSLATLRMNRPEMSTQDEHRRLSVKRSRITR